MITLVFLLLLSLLTLTGCGSNGSGSVRIPEEPSPVLNIRGFINLQNITFPTSICGDNEQFRDLSVFNLRIQDNAKYLIEASSNGQFSFLNLKPNEQIVIQCYYKDNPNLVFEWMGASSNGLTGDISPTISLYSTARSFIARTLRDRYGRRIKPEAIPEQYLVNTVTAITEVIERLPESLINNRLDQIDSVKSAYTSMADSLANGGSGTYPKSHVFLFYLTGDNDLCFHMENTVNKIANTGLVSDCEIILAFDTANSLPVLNKKGAARYRVGKNGLEVLNDLGELDSSNSYYLQKFLEVSMREYPAKGYSLILNSHGGVWRDKERENSSNSIRGIFANDYTSLATGTVLNFTSAIENALSTNNANNRKFDMIVLDSCNLGSIETAYEFSKLTSYTVFSQALMPATGIPYDKFFYELSLTDINNLTQVQIAKLIAKVFTDKYVNVSGAIDTGITVINNSAIQEFVNRLDAFFSKAWNYRDEYLPIFYNIRTSTTVNDGKENTGSLLRCFSPTNEFVDLKQFIDLCIYDKQMYFLNEEYGLLEPHFDKIITYRSYSSKLENANGISITFPLKDIYQYYYMAKVTPGKPLQHRADEYFNLKFCKTTKWKDILDYMLSQ